MILSVVNRHSVLFYTFLTLREYKWNQINPVWVDLVLFILSLELNQHSGFYYVVSWVLLFSLLLFTALP